MPERSDPAQTVLQPRPLDAAEEVGARVDQIQSAPPPESVQAILPTQLACSEHLEVRPDFPSVGVAPAIGTVGEATPAPSDALPSPGSGSWPGRSTGREGQIPIGTVLNHIYRVDRLIARGGMGEVYEGVNVSDVEERVAIKIILPHLAGDANVQALFRAEARTLTKLAHPGLVQYRLLALEPQLNVLYIVTEFVDGPALSEVLSSIEASPDALAQFIRRLASALAAAHALGKIHRDMSPDNVLLPHGKLDQAKIIDFGIAKDLAAAQGKTIVGSGFAGKLGYVAPEQFGDSKDVGPWTDVYSLGLVALALALRDAPAMGTTFAEAMEKRRHVPDLAAMSPLLRPVVARMVQPDRAQRYQSMDEVVAAIDQIPRLQMQVSHDIDGNEAIRNAPLASAALRNAARESTGATAASRGLQFGLVAGTAAAGGALRSAAVLIAVLRRLLSYVRGVVIAALRGLRSVVTGAAAGLGRLWSGLIGAAATAYRGFKFAGIAAGAGVQWAARFATAGVGGALRGLRSVATGAAAGSGRLWSVLIAIAAASFIAAGAGARQLGRSAASGASGARRGLRSVATGAAAGSGRLWSVLIAIAAALFHGLRSAVIAAGAGGGWVARSATSSIVGALRALRLAILAVAVASWRFASQPVFVGVLAAVLLTAIGLIGWRAVNPMNLLHSMNLLPRKSEITAAVAPTVKLLPAPLPREMRARPPIARPVESRPAALPPQKPARAAPIPAPVYAETISGPAQVIDTATLAINGQRISLAGIEGLGGTYADTFRTHVSLLGNPVCDRVGSGPYYTCVVHTGVNELVDLSEMALANGVARTSDSATPDQIKREVDAKDANLGVWAVHTRRRQHANQ